jgi:hypothetical protein
MNTSLFRRLASAVAMSLAIVVMASAARADQPTFRDLVRKYVANQTAGVKPEKIPGLPADLQKVVALEYTVLWRHDGMDEAIDANSHQFVIGDQIRVRIKPLSELYIYIFHEGASGERVCLLPTDQEKPPLAKPGQTLDLPTDGSVFEFSPPAGEEKLIVVATEEPSDDLAALSHVVFKKPEDQLTPAEKELADKLKARSQKTLKSIRDRQAQGTRYRGLFTDDAVGQVSKEAGEKHTTRAVLEEPPSGKQSSTFAMSAAQNGEMPIELYVTIPLKSVQGKGGK